MSNHITDRDTGYGVSSGFETLTKLGPNVWLYTDEDGDQHHLDDNEAAEVLENVFPGS